MSDRVLMWSAWCAGLLHILMMYQGPSPMVMTGFITSVAVMLYAHELELPRYQALVDHALDYLLPVFDSFQSTVGFLIVPTTIFLALAATNPPGTGLAYLASLGIMFTVLTYMYARVVDQ